MVRSFSIGLPILLLLSLYLLYRKLTGGLKVANVPPNFQMLMERQFQTSKYKNLLNYWIAVSKMETEGFTSGLFVNANNPWGMKIPRIRKTTAHSRTWGSAGRNTNLIPTQQGDFAKYETLSDGVKDIVLYMDAMGYPTDTPNLISFVQLMKSKGYFANESIDSYYNKVRAWLKR